MNKLLQKNILIDWENFPYKIDFIIYSIFSRQSSLPDIVFIEDSDFYYPIIDGEKQLHLFIHRDDIHQALNINVSLNDEQTVYKTHVFSQSNSFRVQKTTLENSLITFRLLSQTCDFNCLNTLINKYLLQKKLKEDLVSHAVTEKIIKI